MLGRLGRHDSNEPPHVNDGKDARLIRRFRLDAIPLGILTGMGFIRGGAILRRGEMVKGVTTAATLWLTTVIGLCLGGGQLGLGLASLVVALLVLWGLKYFELWIRQDRYAVLSLRMVADVSREEELRAMLHRAGYRISSWDITYKTREDTRLCILRCEMYWLEQPGDPHMPTILTDFKQQPGVLALLWKT